jgi:hypothetical protein
MFCTESIYGHSIEIKKNLKSMDIRLSHSMVVYIFKLSLSSFEGPGSPPVGDQPKNLML